MFSASNVTCSSSHVTSPRGKILDFFLRTEKNRGIFLAKFFMNTHLYRDLLALSVEIMLAQGRLRVGQFGGGSQASTSFITNIIIYFSTAQ